MKTQQDSANKKRAKQMAKKLLPSLKVHNQYIQQSKKYCQTFWNSYINTDGIPIKKIELITSDLFRRDYLVGFVNSSWLYEMAPGCNAVATPSLEIGKLKSPPIVLVAANTSLKKNSNLHSIIEHEFVHVNQALNNHFPSNFENTKIDLTEQFIHYVYSEYEANFLQLEFWPKLRPPKKYGLELNEWCFLRGYTQALEKLLLAAILEKFSDKKLFLALNKIPKSLETFLLKLDIETEINFQFIEKLKVFSFQALQVIVQPDDLTASQYLVYKKILKWLEPDLKPQPK